MELGRDLTRWANWILDQLVPPILRDSRWFMFLPFRVLFGEKAALFFDFKDKAPFLTDEEFREIYANAAPTFIQRETDLNDRCIKAVERDVVGKTVLDVACGRGFLAGRLAEKFSVTGVDIVIDKKALSLFPRVTFREASVENLPFPDGAFDTVICAHTLEHVLRPENAINELRRVCKKRLIVIVPRQRSYKYTFDFHIHFFPYAADLIRFIGRRPGQSISEIDGDWYLREDFS